MTRIMSIALLWGSCFAPVAWADPSLKVGSEVFDSLNETREQLLSLMDQNERQVDSLLKLVQKDPEIRAIISRSAKRNKAFQKLIKEYQRLRRTLEMNRRTNVYDTDRQVFSAQISTASEANGKITSYINSLQHIQKRAYEILFMREDALK